MLDVTEEVILDCGDSVRLQGYYSPNANPDAPLVVLLHGWEGSANSMYLLSSAQSLFAAGYSIFRLNLRDHGESHHLNEELFIRAGWMRLLERLKKYIPSISHNGFIWADTH